MNERPTDDDTPPTSETPPSATPTYDRLPLRRQRFVREYVATGVGSEAARRAGYVTATPHVASVTSARLLATDSIRAGVSEVAAAALEAAGTGAAEALRMLRHIGERPADYGGGPAVAAASRILEVALPREGAPSSQHLHVSVSSGEMRSLAQRLAASYGAEAASEQPPSG